MLHFDKRDRLFNTIVYIILGVFCAIMLVPLIYIIANSISDFNEVYQGNVNLIPKKIDFTAYKYVLSNEYILKGYGNTILYTVVGTIISLVLTFTAAYPLSRYDFKYKRIIKLIFVITMFVNGGMIPTYLVVDSLGIKDTMFGFILPGCLSVWNIMVVVTYISQAIPKELYEASKMDGCSDFRMFTTIVLPLCKPIIAIMVLFYAVGYWNSYFNSLLYLSDTDLYQLQRILSDIIISNDFSSMQTAGGSLAEQGRMMESIKYVTIVVSSAPILMLYPFLQKYFEKGMLVGSIKE